MFLLLVCPSEPCYQTPAVHILAYKFHKGDPGRKYKKMAESVGGNNKRSDY
jgi:hypothetical protein